MTICITGGEGFIGSHLAKALPDAKLFKYPESDLRFLPDALDFIEEHKPDVVYHLAAQSVVTNIDELESMTTNIAGTYNLLSACKRVGCVKSFVHISTDKVYGTNANARRYDILRGIGDPYTASKHCGDIIAQNYWAYWGIPIRIIRTANIYGPGDTHLDRIIPGNIVDILNGNVRENRGNPSWIRDFIYIDDLIPAYIRIADEEPGIYNLGSQYYTLREVVELIHKLMEVRTPPLWKFSARNEIPFQHIVDCPDWWKPETDLDTGLRKTIEWYKENI